MLRIADVLRLLVVLSLVGCGGNAGTRATAQTPEGTPNGESATARSPLIAPATAKIDSLFPEACLTREFTAPFPYLGIYDPCNLLLGFQTESDFAGTTDSGFYGPVPVRVFLDTLARVAGFDVLANDETPVYLSLACDSLVCRLARYRPGRKETVDAVTLATVSSRAIITAVTGVADRFAEEVLRARPRGD